MKKAILTIVLMVAFLSNSETVERAVILLPEAIRPYEAIWNAVCEVESSGDRFAYNPTEQATGISQIRPIRVLDYNIRTGKKYTLIDMYDVEISKEVFMYYACRIVDRDEIIKRWNGRGLKAEIYLKKVLTKIN
jgi:hypothetical protein